MIEGLFSWQDQTQFRVDAPERGAYRRFPWARLYDGKAAAWFAKQPAGRPLCIALQELVPDSQSLPSNHGLPGVSIAGVWGGAFIPDYNHLSFLTAYEAQMKRLIVLAGSRDFAVDFSLGKWGENHWYGIPDAYRYLLPTLATTNAIVALHLRLFGAARLLAPVDSRVAFDLLFDAGVRNVFHHGWGLIDDNGRDHFERHWADAAYAARLDQCRIRVERGSEEARKLSYPWMLASVKRHPNIIAVANDWPGILTATAETKATINTIISTVASRLTQTPPPPPPPPSEVAVLQAQIVALQTERDDLRRLLAQSESDRTIATNRYTMLANAARKLVFATTNAATALHQLEALAAVQP